MACVAEDDLEFGWSPHACTQCYGLNYGFTEARQTLYLLNHTPPFIKHDYCMCVRPEDKLNVHSIFTWKSSSHGKYFYFTDHSICFPLAWTGLTL